MANYRLINTKFWDDNYITTLTGSEKLLFLYFLTNSSVEICGAYEISIRKILSETGLSKSLAQVAIDKFMHDERIIYRDGWVFIPNFIKNQALNPSVIKGITRTLLNTPDWIQKQADWDRLGQAPPKLSVTKLNLTKLIAGDKPVRDRPKTISNSQALLDWFNSINPALGYKNKTEWDAADWVFAQKGDDGEPITLEEVLAMCQYLHDNRLEAFAHIVTKPSELKRSWVKIQINQERKIHGKN